MKFLLLLLITSCMNQDTTFVDGILKDFDRNSSFLVIKVNSSNYNGPVVVENDDLYYYFNQTKQLNEQQYQAFVKEKIIKHEPVDIGSEDLSKWNFIKVPSVKSVEQNASKGSDNFIKTYFKGRVLKDGISDDQRVAIIHKLFDWKIAAKTDDETGYLVINR